MRLQTSLAAYSNSLDTRLFCLMEDIKETSANKLNTAVSNRDFIQAFELTSPQRMFTFALRL